MDNFIEIEVKDFNLDHIFDCGQCFRWEKREDGSYLRTINSINELFDVSPVYKAAYSSTTVNTRGLDELKQKEQKEIDEYYQKLEAKLK